MPGGQITKRVLAGALKDLMADMPLSKISVGLITKHCGVNRQTFYYHFKDKFDLVSWIYYTETIAHMSQFSDRQSWADGLLSLCLYMQENKKFYINALSTGGQNSFGEYLAQFVYELVLSMVEDFYGEGVVPEKDARFVAEFSIGFVGIITRWAKSMTEDPTQYIDSLKRLFGRRYFMEKFFLAGGKCPPHLF